MFIIHILLIETSEYRLHVIIIQSHEWILCLQNQWFQQRAFNRSSFQPTFVFQEICMPLTYLRFEFYCTIAKKNRNLRISYMATRLSMADTVTKDEFFAACNGSRKGIFAVFLRWSFQPSSIGSGMQQACARAAAAKNIKPCICVFTLGWWLHAFRYKFEFHNHQRSHETKTWGKGQL